MLGKNKTSNLKLIISVIITYFLIIILNYYFGTQHILDAHQNQFRGGMCGACQSCIEPICNSQFGFDFYYLYLSLLLFTFVIGFINVVFDKKLFTSIKITLICALSYLILTEIVIQIFSIPVLYTQFQEGRQSLHTSAFSRFNIGFNIFPLFFSIISGFVGNLIGFPFLLVRKRLIRLK